MLSSGHDITSMEFKTVFDRFLEALNKKVKERTTTLSYKILRDTTLAVYEILNTTMLGRLEEIWNSAKQSNCHLGFQDKCAVRPSMEKIRLNRCIIFTRRFK